MHTKVPEAPHTSLTVLSECTQKNLLYLTPPLLLTEIPLVPQNPPTVHKKYLQHLTDTLPAVTHTYLIEQKYLQTSSLPDCTQKYLQYLTPL